MKIQFDNDDLRPLVELVVTEALDRIEADRAKTGGRLAFTEPEAAASLGVQPHALRDARLRGELVASRVGKRIVYERDELLRFLRRNRVT
jgi:hypothetical protein